METDPDLDAPGRKPLLGAWEAVSIDNLQAGLLAGDTVAVFRAPLPGTLNVRLSPEEEARAVRFVTPIDQERFRASRRLLRRILARLLECSEQSLSFAPGDHGKPRIVAPPATTGLRFNLSHSHDAWLLAVSRTAEVGVDIERWRADVEVQSLSERFFAPTEARILRGLAGEAALEAFFRAWTRKEALLKARGVGLSGEIGSVAVLAALPGRSFHVGGFVVVDLPTEPGWSAALSIEGGLPAVRLFEITLRRQFEFA